MAHLVILFCIIGTTIALTREPTWKHVNEQLTLKNQTKYFSTEPPRVNDDDNSNILSITISLVVLILFILSMIFVIIRYIKRKRAALLSNTTTVVIRSDVVKSRKYKDPECQNTNQSENNHLCILLETDTADLSTPGQISIQEDQSPESKKPTDTSYFIGSAKSDTLITKTSKRDSQQIAMEQYPAQTDSKVMTDKCTHSTSLIAKDHFNDLNENQINFICEQIGTDLFQLARALKLCQTEEDELKLSTESLKEKAYKTMSLWNKQKGRAATKQVLLEALRSIKRNDIADELDKASSPTTADMETMDDADFAKLRQRLENRYSQISIPQPPGIDQLHLIHDVFVNQDMEIYHGKNEAKKENQQMQLENLFTQGNKFQSVSRILVEGDLGFGKTTLATKIAADWAKREEYIKSLFSLTFLVPLREVGTQQLEEIIVVIINNVIGKHTITKEKLKQFFKDNKVLLLFDGYDELTAVARRSMDSFLLSEEAASCSILVTSRRGFFSNRKVIKFSRQALLFENEEKSKFDNWDTHVVLKGLSALAAKD